MAHRVINFGPGPAVLPLPVLERVRDELLDWRGMGASIIEISHRSAEFEALLHETTALLRELLGVPGNYHICYAHGGGQMQFAMVPMNLIALKPARKALLVDSGLFARRTIEEVPKWGTPVVVASGEATNFASIPNIDPAVLDPEASYLHIITNNTVMGTRWNQWPETGGLPLVADATSEILSRRMDVSRFGVLFAGAQKNLGPSGMAVVIVRDDLLGHALPQTPSLLNYEVMAKDNSLTNTPNTFSIYVTNLVLHWVKEQGGVEAMEARNEEKAQVLYDLLETSGFYRAYAHPGSRSTMNVTFELPSQELNIRFAQEGREAGLLSLKGHSGRGGIRASLYNAMTLEGVRVLASFMGEFERRNG